VGSTVVVVALVILAILATGVAIAIKPTSAQQAVRVDESVPGKFLPVMPGQGTAVVQDDDYLPKVVSVNGQAPQPGVSMPASNGSTPKVAPGPPSVVRSTAALPPGLALPPGGLNLDEWLPQGMADLNQLFPQAASCTPGDADCFVKATGCKPGDVQCLNSMYVACKMGSPSCRGTQVNQANVCRPGSPGCVPTTATCTTPNDPACAPPAGVFAVDCPPGTRCDLPPVDPTEQRGTAATSTQTTVGPPGEGNGLPPGPVPAGAPQQDAVPPPPNANVEPLPPGQLPPPAPGPVDPQAVIEPDPGAVPHGRGAAARNGAPTLPPTP
jgi:hypothetical protein